MNRELFKICVFAGRRRGECYATLIVRRSHAAVFAAALLALTGLGFSGSLAVETAKTVSGIELFAAAAKEMTASLFNTGLAAVSNSISTGTERVHRYEQELKLRAESLETVLKDLKSLEGVDLLETEQIEVSPKVSGPEKAAKLRGSEALGMGGGIERRSRVITSINRDLKTLERSNFIGKNDLSIDPRSAKDLAAKKSSSAPVIEELDFLLERIRQIPIGTPSDGEVSSEFGYRRSPFARRGSQLHSGIDISTEIRSSVTATADGRVVSTGYKTNYGQTVIIEHGGGFETLYGHLSKITVRPGDRVCRGEKIGLVGMTGRTTGPHVHYEIRVDGIARNPRNFIELADLLKLI